MEFVIENLGKVHSARIALNGVTVITGANGSGKSTISRALFTWLTYLKQLDDEIVRERAGDLVEAVNDLLKDKDLPRIFVSFTGRHRLAERLLDRVFWQDQNAVVKWIVDSMSRRAPAYVDLEVLALSMEAHYPSIRDRALAELERKDNALDAFLLERHFYRAFDGQIGTLGDNARVTLVCTISDAGRVRSCVFRDGSVRDMMDVHGNHVLRAFYLEPRHLLDEVGGWSGPNGFIRRSGNRYSVDSDRGWERILNTPMEESELLFSQAEKRKAVNAELDEIVALLHGEFEKEDRTLVFRDHDIRGENGVSLQNVASGAKTMAMVVRGMRNGTIAPGDLLIIDEPESNLHPEWQVAFAKFLVLINAKFDIRVLLNTHSPYFLKALLVHSDRLERSRFCSYYNMVRAEGGVTYDAKPVNDCVDEVFRTMSEPYAKLVHGDNYERRIPR